MADTKIIPAFRIGGVHFLVTALYCFIFLATLHALILRFPNHSLTKALVAYGF